VIKATNRERGVISPPDTPSCKRLHVEAFLKPVYLQACLELWSPGRSLQSAALLSRRHVHGLSVRKLTFYLRPHEFSKPVISSQEKTNLDSRQDTHSQSLSVSVSLSDSLITSLVTCLLSSLLGVFG